MAAYDESLNKFWDDFMALMKGEPADASAFVAGSITAGTILPGTVPVEHIRTEGLVTGHLTNDIIFQGIGKDMIDVEAFDVKKLPR